jgi:N,N'-diacetyllegionaminate synthase
MKCFLIAEAGVNHNGSLDMALELVDVAARCGADAVKFQTFSAGRLVRPGARTAEYQANATGESNQFEMLKRLELSATDHEAIAGRCAERGIEFMSTPFDEEAARLLLDLGMRRIKVPSGEITNIPFLEFLADTDRPLIVSTGMATLEEIGVAVAAIARRRSAHGFAVPLAERVTILHCTSNYPAADEDVNLRAMATIAASTGLPVGYSDHTRGIAVATAAVALGAKVIEKHITLDKSLPGPDHAASISPDEFATLVAQVRTVEAALGSSEKRPTVAELPIRALVRRSVTTRRPLRAGQVITGEDLCLLRPGDGIPPAQLGEVIGTKARRDFNAGVTLQWDDVDRA